MKKSLCAVILAAGDSSRFGQNKLLYRIDNRPMYEHTVALIQKLQPDFTILVTKYLQIIQKIDRNILVVKNNETHLGQSHSMQLAIRAALNQNIHFNGYLFTVCDQPYLSIDSLQKLYTVWQDKGGICALSYRQKRGNPVIFAEKYLPELLHISGDTGGRAIIQSHLNDLTLVEVAHYSELTDIDTLDRLTKLRSQNFFRL